MTFTRKLLAVPALPAIFAAASLLGPVAVSAQDAAMPAAPAAAPAPAPAAAPALPASPNLVASGNLVSTLQGSGHFTILVKAVEAAGLSDTLKTAPNLTLFAPTDEAFQALPADQLAQLLAPKNVQLLQKLLIYHLVNAKVDSSKIKGAKGPVLTVESSNLVIDGSTDVLKVNDADIIQADVMAANGVIHVIDKVLVPGDLTLPAPTAAAASPPTGG